MHGHAIEARVYAEDPAHGFLPTGGTVLALEEPNGPGVRVDSGLFAGTVVGSDYDPMLAKVIAYGDDRAAALRGLDRALADTAVLGVVTNIDFLRFLLADDDVVAGRLDTGLLDRRVGDYAPAGAGDDEFIAAAAYRWLQRWRRRGERICGRCRRVGGWARTPPTVSRLRSGERIDHVRITGTPEAATAAVEHGETRSLTATLDGDRLTITFGGLRTEYRVAAADHQIWLAVGRRSWLCSRKCARLRCGPTTSTAATPNSSARCRVRSSRSTSRPARRWPPAPSSSPSRR